MTDLADMILGEVAELIAARRVSPVEVTEACLARAAATEPRLNAFSLLLPESALAEAEIMAGGHRGPLHGIPVEVKEMFDRAGHPTTASSRVYAGNIAAEDSAAVARLRQTGAVIVGKTHTHELAHGVTTPQSRNLWGADHTPGGSSGGSVASVAVGSCFMALGTDTGGSIRIPAACGVTGLKPTFGQCSRFDVLPLSPTLDHVGPLTRTAADAALCLQILAGYDPRDPGSIDIPVPSGWGSPEPMQTGLRLASRPAAFLTRSIDRWPASSQRRSARSAMPGRTSWTSRCPGRRTTRRSRTRSACRRRARSTPAAIARRRSSSP